MKYVPCNFPSITLFILLTVDQNCCHKANQQCWHDTTVISDTGSKVTANTSYKGYC